MHFMSFRGKISFLVMGQFGFSLQVHCRYGERNRKRAEIDASSHEKLATHGCCQLPKVWRYKNQHGHIWGTCPLSPSYCATERLLSSSLVFIIRIGLCSSRVVLFSTHLRSALLWTSAVSTVVAISSPPTFRVHDSFTDTDIY